MRRLSAWIAQVPPRLKAKLVHEIKQIPSVFRAKLAFYGIFIIMGFGAGLFHPFGLALGLPDFGAAIFGGVLMLTLIAGCGVGAMWHAKVDPYVWWDEVSEALAVDPAVEQRYQEARNRRITTGEFWFGTVIYSVMIGAVSVILIDILLINLGIPIRQDVNTGVFVLFGGLGARYGYRRMKRRQARRERGDW